MWGGGKHVKLNRKYLTISAYVLIGSMIVAAFTACVYRFSDVLAFLKTIWMAVQPIFYGIIIALAVNPMYSFFHNRAFAFVEKRKQHPILKKSLALIATYLILAVLLVAVLAAILPQLISSCEEIAVKSTAYLSSALDWLDSELSVLSIPNFLLSTAEPNENVNIHELHNLSIEEYITSLRYGARSPLQRARVELSLLLKDRFIRVDISRMIQDTIDHGIDALTSMIPSLLLSFNQFLNEMKSILLGIVISIYFLIAKERIRALTKKILYTIFGEKRNRSIAYLGRTAYHVIIEFMTGKTLDAIIVMLFSYVVLALFGMPYPILLSCIIGLMNIIPFLGPIVGAVVCGCIVFVFSPSKTIFFLLLIFAIQQLDLHLLEPHIIGPKQYLSNFWILIAVVIMGRAFGIFGCFIAVPTFAVAGILYRAWLDKRTAKASCNNQVAEQE